jgi:hypothetical protein
MQQQQQAINNNNVDLQDLLLRCCFRIPQTRTPFLLVLVLLLRTSPSTATMVIGLFLVLVSPCCWTERLHSQPQQQQKPRVIQSRLHIDVTGSVVSCGRDDDSSSQREEHNRMVLFLLLRVNRKFLDLLA